MTTKSNDHIDAELITRIAVLENQQNTTQQLLRTIDGKLDVVVQINGQLSRAKERQEQHEGMISRAFKNIESNESLLIAEKEKRTQAVQEVKDEVSKWVNRGIGAWFVLGVVGMCAVGMIIYFFNSREAMIANNAAKIEQIDRRVLVIENKGR